MNTETPRWPRRTLLFGVPLVYFCLTLLHPTLNPVFGDDVTLWMTLHVVQLFLIGGMACAFWVLVADLDNRAARLARALILPYVIAYTAVDAIIGLAAGAQVTVANNAAPADRAGAERLVVELNEPTVGGYVLYFSAAVLWLALALSVVIARKETAPMGAMIVFSLGALVFAAGHPRPFGPTGMALLAAGVIWMELWPRASRGRRPAVDEHRASPGLAPG